MGARKKKKAAVSPLIACPSCARKLSPAAVTCPGCGHPMTPAASGTGGFWSQARGEWLLIRRIGWWVGVFLVLPTLTLPAVIAKLTSPGLAGKDTAEQIVTSFLLTAPLSIAVATVALMRDYFTASLESAGPYVGLFMLALTLAVPPLLLGLFGVDLPVDIAALFRLAADTSSQIVARTVMFLWLVLSTYWKAYGPWPFLSAVVVGAFLGWAGSRFVALLRTR